jgi:hypothetical protein
VNVRWWVDLGKETIVRLLENEHAAVWPEIEAKAADRTYPGNTRRIQPHHLTTARKELRDAGVINEQSAPTRGGREVPFMTLTHVGRHGEAVKEAAARKRLLQARYLSWSVSLNLLGPAGERATRVALGAVAATAGYRIENPDDGEVASLFGEPVEGGPLDAAGHLQVVDNRGISTGVVTLTIEVKNVREWIYADSERLHQLLYKSASMKRRFPEVDIVPVLVCRRGAYNTFQMARAFGFYVADAKAQFLPRREDVPPSAVEEVAAELGYRDLTQEQEPNRLLRAHFGGSLPKVVSRAAGDWAEYGPQYIDRFERLPDPALSRPDRAALADELENATKRILGEQEEEEEEEEEEEWRGEEPDWEPLDWRDYE